MVSTPTKDALSHALTLIGLQGDCVYSAELRGNGAASFKSGGCHFHFVESGVLWVHTSASEEPVRISSGGLVLLARGTGHAISARPEAKGPFEEFFHDTVFDAVSGRAILGAGGAPTRLVGAQFSFERLRQSPSVRALPPMIHVRHQNSDVEPSLPLLARSLLEEAAQAQPGSALVVSRTIDLIVIRALRQWASTQPPELGWFGSVEAERIGRALNAIHAQPWRRWTVEELARIANMSRSVFGQRFAEAAGEPPQRYITRWRRSIANPTVTPPPE